MITKPYTDQQPGTSGLRKKVKIFQQKNYLENYIQAIFDAIGGIKGQILVLGGDGRFFNAQAVQTILKMAAANGCSGLIVGKKGYLSTPAASYLIRKCKAKGGIILSASHNPGGKDADFGIKYNIETGSAAPQSVTDKIFSISKIITRYKICDLPEIDLTTPGNFFLGDMNIEIIDSVKDYAELMEQIFDFELIANAISKGLDFHFNAMHAVSGEYAIEIFHRRLGVPLGNIKNAQVLEDFGGGHPDPTPQNLGSFFNDFITAKVGYDLGGACDGDGDRNLILGRGQYVSPSDSLAILLHHANLINYYKASLYGIARSMPTSQAVDIVANKLGIPLYETPTGWKFFGNLLDAKKIAFCGEESFGAGSFHVREKDGIWAILFWLHIVAATKKSVNQLVLEHWHNYGRHYYARYDYEGLDKLKAEFFMAELRTRLPQLMNQQIEEVTIVAADDFSYYDEQDKSCADKQGIRIILATGQRIIYRLSGTGTSGAVLRLYIEHYETDLACLQLGTQDVLRPFLRIAEKLAKIKALLDKDKPDLIV